MSIVERTPSPPPAVPAIPVSEVLRPTQRAQREVPGCRLCRALAHRLHPISAESPVWAVGSVTIDDLERFGSNG
jgi:hypothetical protein